MSKTMTPLLMVFYLQNYSDITLTSSFAAVIFNNSVEHNYYLAGELLDIYHNIAAFIYLAKALMSASFTRLVEM